MDISLTNRLSFKQAGLTVLVAFILGTLLSVTQVAVDYASEEASINREIRALLEISHNPAARIAYNIDAELAQELVLGLLRSPAVTRAELIDNSGLVLASVSRPRRESRYRVFSDSLFGAQRQFQDPLHVSHAPDEALGVLRLEVDTYAFGSHFLRRSLLTLLTGFARSLLLSLILLVLFYFMLTKPLTGVIRALSERNPQDPQHRPVPCPKGHERDEIGTLVEVTNRQLSSIAQEIEQRRNAEDRLTQYLNELENIVSARTAELKATNARLSQSNRELEVARTTALNMAQARSAFLANMSHEIRTPLNGLLGMLALALDGPLSAEQRQQLGIAHDSGKVLVELLNDILDLSKFEAGQLVLEEIPFDVSALAEETASLLSQNAASAVELTCLIDPALPTQVLGDPTRVRQIVSNLLSNALKFTRFGRVDLIVACSTEGVSIRVRDTGIGIAEDAQARIFQPFAQAEVGITREYGGTGLGLALTRRLCEAMHGKLTLQSKEGFGSEFCAELPLPAHAQASSQPSLQGRIVAMTPASSGLQQMLSQWLPVWGLGYQRLDTDASLHGVDADLLISDCPECLLGIRPAISTPVLLVTAYGNFLPHDQAQRLMPLLQIARPLARNGLLQVLRHILHSDDGDPHSSAQTQAARESTARVLLVEDNPVNQMVAKGMLAKLGYQVLVAGHGAEALEILEQEPIDLILMDCNMPVMDGYEASRRIRSNGRWPELPIVALTANALSDERERCRAAGMNDYLAKPFRREELAAMLDTWLPDEVNR
ncbi:MULTISPECIES: response regulator [Pseudomonadaceae]|uniref:histidine kinase n=1 Tax=Ectopseudomonas alcaliphila TaxID=101564 RepID=A0A1G7J0F6_9GAMM|nr:MULTISPECIES: response regulator [Pseudomonas]MDP9941492.1 signal transduction histidine kinase/ActR/RegA family two-component response regulator [Pseudomonas sp. 3400]MDR7013711.1 signal transduction histidine kinase/ActR/RegA family two-component response regulator [Pseudomonas alcaliphila]MDX5995308.1 response regulator [Pseudomonas alcaliphila]SDF18336.1 His Kinase A (phospho-acceptor) domain-containing protein [Pseudomonas alcaliphila]